MNEKPNKLQQPTSLANEVNKHFLNLNPYIELAKYVMKTPVCEINIVENYFQGLGAYYVDESFHDDKLYNDTINQNGIYEIEDLRKDRRYKDHSYVTESPHFHYYCGAKLTTANGKDIGSICVLDTKTKRVTNEQKQQLRHLAQLVMNVIEYENKYRGMALELEALTDSFHKLNHDVRTPISGIIGLSDLLIEEKEPIEFPAQELTMIKESAETILNMIDEIMNGTKTGNNGHVEQEENRIETIIKQLKHLYHPPARAKNLSLKFVNQIDTGLNVSQPFALKLLQIIGNLLSNAVKFTPETGALEVTIAEKTGENENMLYIAVKDTGKGMSNDQVAAFNNGNAVTRSAGTNGEQSFGRGLIYVKQMVARAGGTISVKAGENNGTRFSVLLPVLVDSANTYKSMTSFLEDFPKPKTNGKK